MMNNIYAVDLSLRPTTFDFWHVSLAAAVALLALLVIALLSALLLGAFRCRNKQSPAMVQSSTPPEPVVKIVEKIVEVEKIVPGPTPEPVILKESTPDAALQLLSLLQKEARFIDFLKENITAYTDSDIGVAARVVHEGCNKVLNEHFTLAPIREEQEGNKITLAKDFDAASIRLTGNIVGSAPFTGVLVHKGWQVTRFQLPKLTQNYNVNIIAAAEVEL